MTDLSDQEKQSYLRAEILDKGFDTEQFSEFLSTLRPDGDNLQSWNFPDLKDAVTQFITSESKVPHIDQRDIKTQHAFASPVKEINPNSNNKIYGSQKSENFDSDGKPVEVAAYEANSPGHDRKNIARMYLKQSEEDENALNDFTFTASSNTRLLPTELNGEVRVKVKISE